VLGGCTESADQWAPLSRDVKTVIWQSFVESAGQERSTRHAPRPWAARATVGSVVAVSTHVRPPSMVRQSWPPWLSWESGTA
jgi:hypothetical protein